MDVDEDGNRLLEVAGCVVRLSMKNFMCHDHLQVNFNRHINFICGKNGSGKSAILTALVIVLGGKSTDTNRGTNVKGLIKSGCSQATIEITLTNVGPNAYKPEIFGNELTITRVINEKTSLYRLSKPNGKPVKCQRGELAIILGCFKIQISNPISVLNQEMAKSFIKTSNPKDLYKFFMKGTLLSDLEDNIKQSKEVSLPQLKRILKEKTDELDFAFKDVDVIRKKQAKKIQLIDLEKDFEETSAQYIWAQVHLVRKEMDGLKSRLDEILKNIFELDKAIEDKDGSERELILKKEELSEILRVLNEKQKEQSKVALEAERNLVNARNRYKEQRHEKKTQEKKLLSHKSGYEQTQQQLKLHNSKNAEAEAKRNRIESRKEVLRTKIHEFQTIINTNDNHLRNLTVSVEKKNEEISSVQASVHLVSSNIMKAKTRLNELKSHSSELTCFGNYMPKLVQEIQRKKSSFVKQPIGPLGEYIKLNSSDKMYSLFGPAIEAIIGRSLLCGFAVHCQQDFVIFKNICRELHINSMPAAIISPFNNEVYDVTKYKCHHPKYKTMLDALDITHPVVANTIIDQVKVESVLLLPTSEDAYSVMEDVNRVPANCIRAVTPNYLFYPSPNYRSYHQTNQTTTSFLQVNKTSLIKELEKNLLKYSGDEKGQLEKLKSVKVEEAGIKRSLEEAMKENRRIQKELSSSEMELLNLENEESNFSCEQEMLLEDLQHRKNQIDDINRQIAVLDSNLEHLKKEIQSAEEVKENTTTTNYLDDINQIQGQLENLDEAYNEFNVNFGKFKNRKKDEERKKLVIEATLEKLNKDISAKEEKAAKTGRTVQQNDCRTKEQLKERLSEIESEIAEIKDFIGHDTLQEISADLQEKIEKVDTIREMIGETEYWSNQMQIGLDEKLVTLEQLRRDKSKMISYNFNNIMKLRQYKEELIFDHKVKKLSIIVKTDAKNQNVSSVLSLSGGERSFSMVAFILALWQEMAIPFYFLDEFDVFMDPLNRRLIINLLMVHAKNNFDKQFVFLTPNDFQIDITPHVSIFRMTDPRNDAFSEV